MTIEESEEARGEREACPVCRSPQRRSVERMRRVERASLTDLHRCFQVMGEDVSLRWVIRHFGRGHDLLSSTDETDLPAWLFDDEEEFERYMHQYGYCRTIDDLCPHISPRTASTCEQVNHPECDRWQLYTLRERIADLETRPVGPVPAPTPDAPGPHTLIEPLTADQPIEVEAGAGSRSGIYGSTVVSMAPTQLVITLPARLRETLALDPGDRVTIFYRGRVSKYGFETVVRAVEGGRVVVDPPTTIGIASRRSPRIPLQGSAVHVVRVEHKDAPVHGRGVDASLRGVRLALAEELAQWERIRITLTLPDGALEADGEVVRVERVAPNEIMHGIFFTNLSEHDVDRLRRLGR